MGRRPGKANDLVGENPGMLRDRALLHDLKSGVVFQSRDEENARHRPAPEQGVIRIAAVHGHDGTGVPGEGIGQFDTAALGLGEQHVRRQVIVMIQQSVGKIALAGCGGASPALR